MKFGNTSTQRTPGDILKASASQDSFLRRMMEGHFINEIVFKVERPAFCIASFNPLIESFRQGIARAMIS